MLPRNPDVTYMTPRRIRGLAFLIAASTSAFLFYSSTTTYSPPSTGPIEHHTNDATQISLTVIAAIIDAGATFICAFPNYGLLLFSRAPRRPRAIALPAPEIRIAAGPI